MPQGVCAADFSDKLGTSVCLSSLLLLIRKADSSSERSDPLPAGWFNWIPAFYRVPDTEVLHKSSLDGYLFLRYLKLLCVICAVGCLITWPVLLPMHRYGGNGNEQLDLLTFGNVSNPMWYYVHAGQAWLFFGMFVAHLWKVADWSRIHFIYGISGVCVLH